MELSARDFSIQTPYAVNERVNKENRDYAILFKMEGCGWCHKMETVWEQLNKVFGFMRFYTFQVDANQENINQWHKIQRSLKNGAQLQGFPLIMFYNNQNKRVVFHPGYEAFDSMKRKILQFFHA